MFCHDRLQDVVKDSFSYSECLRKLGVINSSSNRHLLSKAIHGLGLDLSHFNAISGNRKSAMFHKLNGDVRAKLHQGEKESIKDTLGRECVLCGLKEQWNGRRIVLHLDHIDGDNKNNLISNLRVLCPNCHSQTDTYGAKNRRKCEKVEKAANRCNCGKVIAVTSNHCSQCYSSQRTHAKSGLKISWPEKGELAKMVWEKPLTTIGKELGVSDNAVKKHCRNLAIECPGRGYWAKVYAEKN